MIFRFQILGLMVLATLFLQCKSDSDIHLFKVALWANEDHTWYEAFRYFEEIVSERSEGRIQIEVYPSEQLAKEIEAIRLIQAGVIDMTVTGSLLSNWLDIAVFCEMPFLLRDSTDQVALLEGPIGERVKNDMLSIAGLRPVALFERGQRHLTSNRPIRHPDELKGLILRVPNVPSFVTAWAAMGAKPTPMAFSEVFTSLQQGTIDAQENPFDLILSAGFAEVQQYINLTAHVVSWSYPVIGEKQFQAMSPELQAIFLTAAIDMERYEHSLFLERENSVKDALVEKGMEFIDVDRDAFNQKCADAIFASLSPEMQVVYRDFIEYRDK